MNPLWTLLSVLLGAIGLIEFPWWSHSTPRLIVALALWTVGLALLGLARARALKGYRKWPWHLPPEVVISDMDKLRSFYGANSKSRRRPG